MRKSESERCASMISAAYRDPMTPEAISLYASLIADLDYAAAVNAIRTAVQTSKWRPTVAEVRGLVAEASLDLPSPELAWGEVYRQIGAWGSQRETQPPWSSPEIARAVDALGWLSICREEHIASTRARFIEAYASIHKTAHTREALRLPRDSSKRLGVTTEQKQLESAKAEDGVQERRAPLSEWGRAVLAKYGGALEGSDEADAIVDRLIAKNPAEGK